MNPETEQILSTLEVLLEPCLEIHLPNNHRSSLVPFVWDVAGSKFNLLNLGQSEGWIKLTDVELVVKSWQELERRICLGPNYLPDNLKYTVDPATAIERGKKFQSLLQLLQSNIKNLEAFRFSFRPYYSFCIVIGKTDDDDWICISPTVARETYIEDDIISRSSLPELTPTRQLNKKTLELQSRIQAIIAEIEPLTIYGYYVAEYKYRFAYHLVCAAATTNELALKKALEAAGMLEIHKFNQFYPNQDYIQSRFNWDEQEELCFRYEKLNQFLKQRLPEMIMFRCSFWNWELIYMIAQNSSRDRLGIYLESEFDFNP